MRSLRILLGSAVGAAVGLLVPLSPGANSARAYDLSQTLGVVHNAGLYYFGSVDSLEQGASQVAAVGGHVIKVEMDQFAPLNTWTSTNNAKYPWNSSWPSGITTLVGLAKTTYFQHLFSNANFHTYVITAYCPAISGIGNPQDYWFNGPNQSAAFAAEQQQFTDLCNYLLTTYKGTGKTFIFENWEGDNALKYAAQNYGHATDQNAINGMIQWFKSREAGIVAARNATPSDVKVYGAVEVNFVQNAMQETSPGNPTWTVTNDVLPHTTVEYGSYSAYDTMYNTSGTYSFANAVAYLATKLPSTAINGKTLASIGIGEFGIPENEKGTASVDTVINNVLPQVINGSMPYCCYWQIQDNEFASTYTGGAPVTADADVRGFFMVKPSGMPSEAWHLWRWQCLDTSPLRATSADVINNGLSLKYTSAFPGSGSTLGNGWTTSTYGGDVAWTCQSGNLVNMQVVANPGAYPYGLATLNIATVTGGALSPGGYVQFTVKRQNDTGYIGVQLFGQNHGSAPGAGVQPLQTYAPTGAWTSISYKWDGTHPTYDFDSTATLGFRLDSADGSLATVSFYVNGNYSGSYIYKTTQTSLSTIGLFAQSNVQNATFQFGNVQVYK